MADASRGESSTTIRSAVELFPEAAEEVRSAYGQLQAVEEQHSLLYDIKEDARVSYEGSRPVVSSGCFGSEVGGDSSVLRRAKRDAEDTLRAHWREQVYPSRLDVESIVSASNTLSPLEKAAAIQGLFQMGLEHRYDYTARFLRALEQLDAELQPGAVVAVRRPAGTSGFFRVLEPGIRARIANVSEGKPGQVERMPRVIVSTGAVEGVSVRKGSGHSDLVLDKWEQPEPEGVILYGTRSGDHNADDLAVLERDFLGREDIGSISNAFGVGYETTELIVRLPVLESFLHLVAARTMGELVDVREKLERQNSRDLTKEIRETIIARIMGAKVPDSQHPTYWYSSSRVHNYIGVANIHSEHPQVLGSLAQVLRLTERNLRSSAETAINRLEEEILVSGTQPASRLPEIQVGRIRLEPFLRQLFG